MFLEVQELKRKKDIAPYKQSVPKNTCRINIAGMSEVNTNPQNIMSTSSPTDADATYTMPSPPEYSEDGMQSIANDIENNSEHQSMVKTLPASQAVLEGARSSSAYILQECQTRKTDPDGDGKHIM